MSSSKQNYAFVFLFFVFALGCGTGQLNGRADDEATDGAIGLGDGLAVGSDGEESAQVDRAGLSVDGGVNADADGSLGADMPNVSTFEQTCEVGAEIPEQGCMCRDVYYSSGYCCANSWQGYACDYRPTTCAELGVDNCVEVWPQEQRDGYEYISAHDAYFFRNVSNANHYFLLMGDIACDGTCAVFGFNDGTPDSDARTVFDLNGHTVTYSAADYETLPNNGFDQWTDDTPNDWTVISGSVESRSTAYYMPMHGSSVLYASGPAVIESSLISLPVARAYRGYVTVGRAAETDITLDVVRADGQVMCSETKPGFFRGQSFACRFDSDGAAQYRLRLTTNGYAYLDRTGIVPLGDYGVGVFTAWSLSDSNSNQLPVAQNLSGADIPTTGDVASPERFNQLEVKNGTIVAGHENQVSYGVSLSGIVRLTLHGVTIVGDGLKSHTVRGGGEIYNCHLEAHMPWYFARENSDEENVILGGGSFHHNAAIGGQGVIRLGGDHTEVYSNYLRNHAQATNHYAIIHSGATNPEIHHNIFDPIEGSGILTYVGHGYRIHHNVFFVKTAPCNVEYINEDYSTNGIRMNDYGAKTNYDNWVNDNSFIIEGLDFDTAWDNCMPVTSGIFYSASGDNNRIFNNTFQVTKTHANERAPVYALYMGGGAYNSPVGNKLVYDNVFETNDKAVWITTFYGDSRNLWLENNVFRRVTNNYYTPAAPQAALQMGNWTANADGVVLVNNHFEGGFETNAIHFTATSSSAAYDLTVRWYLNVTVQDANGNPVEGALVRAQSQSNSEQAQETTNAQGQVVLTLTEYQESGDMTSSGTHARVAVTPHTITAQKDGLSATAEPIAVSGEQSLLLELTGSGDAN